MSHCTQILNVADDTDVADSIAAYLDRRDGQFRIETATDAREGVARLSDADVDCIVSEYDLPGRDGIEFLETVRENYPTLPFILHTAKGSEEVASEAISAGVTEYVQKETATGQAEKVGNRISAVVSAQQSTQDGEHRSHRLEQLLQTVPSCVVHIDCDGEFIFANEPAKDMLGLNHEDLTERAYTDPEWDITDLEGNPIPEKKLPFRQVRDSGEQIHDFKHTIELPDGTRNVLSVNGAPVFDDHGTVESILLTITDITEQRERERELSDLKEEFETVFTTAQDALFLYNVEQTDGEYEFRLRQLNPAHEAITGLSAENLRGATPQEIVGDEQGAEVEANLRRCLEAQEPISYEEVLEMPTGQHTWQTKLGPVIKDGEVTQIVGVARNITDQRKREQQLRETSERLDLALQATDTGIWEWNMETDEVVWNETLERLLGIEPGTFEGTYEAHAEYLHPDDIPKVEQKIGDALDTDGEFQAEFRMERKDGEQIWVEGRGKVLTENGPRRMIGTTTDITDRKESEQALARREVLEPSIELEYHSDEIAQNVLEQSEDDLELSLDGVVPQSDGTQRLYGTAQGPTASDLQSILEAIPTVREARLLSTVGETHRYEVFTKEGSIPAVFARFDGELQSFVIKNNTCELIGKFPETVDPEAVTQAVQETYSDIELVSRQRIVTPSYLRSAIEDELTERQRTVLGMAYYAKYFDQPRQSTGDELADRLGITRQTFNSHLRKAQAEVLHAIFEKSVDLPH